MTALVPAHAPPEEIVGADGQTIDELAAASKVPSRTIRFYQAKGVLPRPELRGRVAYYGPAHVERLKLIAKLQDRGLRIDAIRELLARTDSGELDVNEWLGLDAQLQGPWAHDQPRTMTGPEIAALVEEPRPGLLAALARARLVARHGDVYLVKSPALLQVAIRLLAAGVDLDISREAADILRKHLGRAAGALAEHFFAHARDGFGRDATPEDLAAVFQELRPMGLEAVRVVFAQEMERVLREKAASGETAKLRVGSKKRARP